MSWSTALADLRTALSDGATDKLRHQKPAIGIKDGVNKAFKTLEARRLTAFTGTPASPFGAFVNGALAVVDSEDLVSGQFTLHTAPANTDEVAGTYYIQWFTDAELNGFLRLAALWLGQGSDPSQIADSLTPAALKYASADCYQKLAVRWAETLTETFRTEDAPKDLKAAIDSYRQLADQYRKEATAQRDDFYKRQGQANAPTFASSPGRVRSVVPRR